MLISCFQCRQPMDVAEDSAGKRVRCPHCQHVIVVPTPAKFDVPSENISSVPVLALPNLDLEAEERPPEVKTPVVPVAPSSKVDLPAEEAPPLPPIARPKRRRAPEINVARYSTPWGKIVGIGSGVALLVVVLFGAIAGDLFRRPQPQPIVFNPPIVAVPQQPPQAMPRIEIPRFEMPKGQPPLVQFPGAFALADLKWQELGIPERRFRVSLPGPGPGPVPGNEGRLDPMLKFTVFEARHDDWEFAVAHRSMPETEFNRIAITERFRQLQQTLRERFNPFVVMHETVIHLNGIHPGREWSLNANGKTQYARSYFVRDQDQIHHYLLTAQGPFNTNRNHPHIERFFNSFAVNVAEGGNANVGFVVREEKDDLSAGAARDNEYTALALHPNRPLAILGSAKSCVSVVSLAGPADPLQEFVLEGGKPIEQIVLSADGRWLALAVDGAIEYRCDWDKDEQCKCFRAPGQRCVFSEDGQLLIALDHEVKPYNPATVTPGEPLVHDFAIRGLTLSPNDRTLAVWGDKTIALWSWPDKKPLGRIEAHTEPITRVAFSPDGKWLASASVDRTVKLWNTAMREEKAILKEHAWTVWDLAFHPDGNRLVSVGLDGMMLVWDRLFESPRLTWAQAQQFPIRNVAFAADGKHCFLTCKQPNRDDRVAGRQYTRQLRKIAWSDVIARPREAAKIVAERAGLHLPTVGTIFFTPNGRSILTAGDSLEGNANLHPLRIWDTASARVKHTHRAQFGGALSPDGKWFVFAGAGKLQVLNVEKNEVLPEALPFNLNYVPAPVVFGPDGKSFWITLQTKFVRVEFLPRLVRTKEIKLREPNEPINTRLVSILPAADHKSFLIDITPQNDRRTRTVYATKDGTELTPPERDEEDWSAFTRLRRHVDRSVVLEDVLRGKSVAIGQQRSLLQFSAVTADRTHCATEETFGGQALRIVVWDPKERCPVLTLPEPNARSASQLRFSSDGRHLAWTTNAGWTRVVPVDWLLERKALLPCNSKEVSAP